jgi:hypothetical protein
VQVDIEPWDKGWTFHPNPKIDIAVRPIGPLIAKANEQAAVFRRILDPWMLPGDAELRALDAIEEVKILGRHEFAAPLSISLRLFAQTSFLITIKHGAPLGEHVGAECLCRSRQSGMEAYATAQAFTMAQTVCRRPEGSLRISARGACRQVHAEAE